MTDPLAPKQLLGPSKIDSIQNSIMLSATIHSAWDRYTYGIDVQVRVIIVSFVTAKVPSVIIWL